MTNGTTYIFTVTATNLQGSGSPSAPSNSVTILASQTLSFGAAPTVSVGGAGTVSANGGGSGNPIVFSSLTQGICTIAGTTVTGVSTGTCIIAADQAGNATYSAAPQLTQNFLIGLPTSASGNNPGGAGTVTISVGTNPAGCGFSTAQFIALPNSAAASQPPQLTFPYGMGNFTIAGACGNGSSATVTIMYPATLPANAQFWKYGKTAANQTDHWYQLTLASNNLQISGNSVTHTLVDGGNGDDDFTANGVIVDPAAVAVPDTGEVASIPAMSDVGMLVLAMLLTCGAFFGFRRNGV